MAAMPAGPLMAVMHVNVDISTTFVLNPQQIQQLPVHRAGLEHTLYVEGCHVCILKPHNVMRLTFWR